MKKVLFIHVPKTGGTSIANFLEHNNMDQWHREYPARHDPYFFMQQANNITEDVFSFAVVRNPYTRAYSYYKHFNFQNQLNFSFNEFLQIVKKKIKFRRTPMIIFPQNYYLYDITGNISLSKIYRFENLEEFEYDFNVKLPHLRKGWYNKNDYYNDYNNTNIKLVEEIYNDDFKILNYPKIFT